MITHHDFFCGPLGKVSKLELPRMYSSPRTNRLIHDYSVSLGSNIRGEFLACSLDSRLWLFRLSRRLTVVVCNWDDNTKKLVRSASSNISNNYDVILARGINWVLSNNSIFMADDVSPYIRRANLFDNSNDKTFCYSVIRNYAIQDWPLSLNRDPHLLYPANSHIFEQCYSLLPSVGDWIIFENFLIRKPDKPLTAGYHGMLNIKPLIPLELHYNNGSERCSPAYGLNFASNYRGVQVAYLHNQLWARGLYHIGKVFIIAAGFDKDEEAQEYYLYISPDFHDIYSTTTSDSWHDVAIAAIGDNNYIYGFLSDEADTISGGMCIAATNSMILNASGKNWSWKSLDDSQDDNNKTNSEGKLFFDYANSSALLLDNEGAQVFLDGLEPTYNFSCKNLRQWLAPADQVDAVSDAGIVARADNSAFFTELQRDFHRGLFAPCSLPLSEKAYSVNNNEQVRLSVAIEANPSTSAISLLVKHSLSDKIDNSSIVWDDVFRKPVTLSYTGKNTVPDGYSLARYAPDFSVFRDETSVRFSQIYPNVDSANFSDNRAFCLWGHQDWGSPYPIWVSDIELSDIASYNQIIDLDNWPDVDRIYEPERYYHDYGTPEWHSYGNDKYFYNSASATVAIFDPQNPSFRQLLPISSSSVSWIATANVVYSDEQIAFDFDHMNNDWFTPVYVSSNYTVLEGYQFHIEYKGGEQCSNSVVGTIPENILGKNSAYEFFSQQDSNHDLSFLTDDKINSLIRPSIALKAIRAYQDSSLSYAIFQSRDSNIYFSLDFSEANINPNNCLYFWNFPDASTAFLKPNGYLYSRVNYHIAVVDTFDDTLQDWVQVLYYFRSEYNHNIFDFDLDLERCKSS